MRISGYTDIGCRYDVNQDCFLAGKVNESTCWLVVCDGMGGLAEGELASRSVCRSMGDKLDAALSAFVPADEAGAVLRDVVWQSNNELYIENVKRKDLEQMGTTVVAAVVTGGSVSVAHCGDSRAYLISRKQIRQVTRDHSVVQELVDAGRLSAEQARNHPNKNVITRALGVEIDVETDLDEFRMGRGDVLLLCSDGLSNMLSDQEILKTVLSTDFYACPGTLVRKALDMGGFDNITALMFMM